MATTKSTTKGTTGRDTSSGSWTAEERAAMRERAKEMKAEQRATRDRAAGEADVQAKIAEMPPSDRVIAERIHGIVTANAPELVPRTWYGMPAYAREGRIVCFFQAAAKFGARYATLGFNDAATLDEGSMWPTAWAVTSLSAEDESSIAALVRRAVG